MTITPTRDETRLDLTPLSGTIGTEIRGVDLSRPLTDDQVAAIRAVLLERKVVFFPGQHLDADQHIAFASAFGEVTSAHPVIPGIESHPEVFEIDYTEAGRLYDYYGDISNRARGIAWHTDVTFVARPPLGSILNAVVIPPAGGDTLFSDQQAAYDGLSAPLQEFLGTLTAVHDGQAQFGPLLKRFERGEWEGETFTALEPVEHPVVRTHPETGRKALFVNPGFTSHIKGLNRPESDALLAFLYQHATRDEYVVRYHWHAGDLGFWDNRVTQHAVSGDFGDQPRVIQRITLRGDAPA
jgi:taurine dioxygenase